MLMNHFGLSGGKDSTALWLWALFESGYPVESLRGSFCDTENEYEEVYEQIRILDQVGQARGAAPIRTLRNTEPWTWENPGVPLFLKLAMHKKRFPGPKSRFCTEWLKIRPMIYYMQELLLAGFEVLLHSGVRSAESLERSLMEEWGTRDGFRIRRPLLKFSIQDVWAIHHRYGVPINPLYLTGRRRVGCELCIMSNKRDVRIAAKTRPLTILKLRYWERAVGHSLGDGQFASFFPARTVPEHLRSIKGQVRRRDGLRGKKGETYSICTIDDVVKWSLTERGGKQLGFSETFGDEPIFDLDDAHEPCKSGVCE